LCGIEEGVPCAVATEGIGRLILGGKKRRNQEDGPETTVTGARGSKRCLNECEKGVSLYVRGLRRVRQATEQARPSKKNEAEC
jgi:hypothetical protein